MLERISRHADHRHRARRQHRHRATRPSPAGRALRPTARLRRTASATAAARRRRQSSSIGSRSRSRGTPRASACCRRASWPETSRNRSARPAPRAVRAAAWRGPCPGNDRRPRRPPRRPVGIDGDVRGNGNRQQMIRRLQAVDDQRQRAVRIARIGHSFDEALGRFSRREEAFPSRLGRQIVKELPDRFAVGRRDLANRRDGSIAQHEPRAVDLVAGRKRWRNRPSVRHARSRPADRA